MTTTPPAESPSESAPHSWEWDIHSPHNRSSLEFPARGGVRGVRCEYCRATGYQTFQIIPSRYDDDTHLAFPTQHTYGPVMTDAHGVCPGYALAERKFNVHLDITFRSVELVLLVLASIGMVESHRHMTLSQLAHRWYAPLFVLAPVLVAIAVWRITRARKELVLVRGLIARARGTGTVVAFKSETSFGLTPTPSGEPMRPVLSTMSKSGIATAILRGGTPPSFVAECLDCMDAEHHKIRGELRSDTASSVHQNRPGQWIYSGVRCLRCDRSYTVEAFTVDDDGGWMTQAPRENGAGVYISVIPSVRAETSVPSKQVASDGDLPSGGSG